MRAPILLLIALALVACDDGDTTTPPADAAVAPDQGAPADATPDAAGPQPELSVEPARLALLAPADGQAEGTLVLSNVGEAPLHVTAVAFDPPSDQFALGDVGPTEIAPGDALTLTITYTPSGAPTDAATLSILSDDADEGELKLPITGRVAARCVRAMPGSVDLGVVQPGVQSGRFRVTVANCGDVDATIRSLRLEGDLGFFWETTDGGDPTGQPFPAGGLISLNLWFENDAVPPDSLLTSSLIIETDDPRPVLITLQVRTTGLMGCHLELAPERLEYGSVRIGTSARQEVTLRNVGLDPCTFRELSIAPAGGPFGFIPLDVEALAGGEETALTVSYAPQALSPAGDRGTLQIDYRDEGLGQNRRETAFVTGVGAEALVAGDPFEGLDFDRVTQPDGCAAEPLTVRALNAGFVPICLTGFDLVGEGCPQFHLLEAPEIADGCLPLEPMEGAPFELQFVPTALGAAACDLVVTSDAMNSPELAIPLVGEGVADAETTDRFDVGRLSANSPARFTLSRRAEAEGMQATVDDAPNAAWTFDAERNAVVFEPGDHPDRGARLRVTYTATCTPAIVP